MEALWEKIASARPRLNPQIVIRRQLYRGETWYLLQDLISERHFRLSPGAYQLVSWFDGIMTLEGIWHRSQQWQIKTPARDDFVRLLMQLQDGGALMRSRESEALQFLERRMRPRQSLQQMRNPLSLRLPLWDPDRVLNKLMPLVQPLFSRAGVVLWLLIVLSGLLQAAVHWQEISHNVTSQLLSADNLLLMGAVYLLMKLFHEAAHGFAAKYWGGEVHQVGVLFLALIPMPYVDASAANGFSERSARMAVGAAGIITELLLASLGLWLWLITEPGWLNAAAYNMMLIGSLSSLLVNGNPLLKFDGYYVFADLIDIPNLSQRANRYLGYLLQRYLYNLQDAQTTTHNNWERGWFISYGIAAFFYRWFILITIMLFVAEEYPLVGWAIALWALVGMVILPLIGQLRFLFTSPRLAVRRRRAILSTTGIFGTLLLILFVIPAPNATLADGIILPPDGKEVRAGTEGEILELLTAPDTQVKQSQPLVALEDPFIRTEIKRLAGRLSTLRAEHEILVSERKTVKAKILFDEIQLAETALKQQRKRAERLQLLSPGKGKFLVQQPGDLPGRFIDQGELIGYVLDQQQPEIRVALSQQAIGLVRSATRHIEARYAHNPEPVLPVRLLQDIPESRFRLPSPALSSLGGGEFIRHPDDEDGTRTLIPVFEMRLQLQHPVSRLGERVIVRFEHPPEPLGQQWFRSMRQMFLRRFNI